MAEVSYCFGRKNGSFTGHRGVRGQQAGDTAALGWGLLIKKEDLARRKIVTTDSYPVKDEKTGEIKWKDKETIWHDVLVFRPNAAHFARDLKKGDAVTISGSLSYQPFKDENGNLKRGANIIANYIEKVEYNRQEELSFDEINALARTV